MDRMARNFLEYVAHISRIKAKVNALCDEEEVSKYEEVKKLLEGFLPGGLTCESEVEFKCLNKG